MQEILNNIIEIFNANPVAQTIGFIAFTVTAYSITRKNDREVLVYSALVNTLFAISFILLGFYIAAGVFAINVFRGIFALKFPRNLKVAIIFFTLYGINAIINYQDYYSLFAIFGSFLFSYSFFFLSGKGIPFRLGMGIGGIMWIIYHYKVGAIGAFSTQIFVLTLNLITIYRLYIDKDFKQDKISLTK